MVVEDTGAVICLFNCVFSIFFFFFEMANVICVFVGLQIYCVFQNKYTLIINKMTHAKKKKTKKFMVVSDGGGSDMSFGGGSCGSGGGGGDSW